MTNRTRFEIAREESFSYLSRCALRGEQGAIDTIKRIERENPRRTPRTLSAEEKARHQNDVGVPF